MMQIPVRTAWRAALIASLAVLFFGVWFQVSLAQHWTRPATLPYGLNNPVLAMQLAKAPWPAAMLEPGNNMAEMTRQQYIDFGYIPCYTALFLCIALLQWSSNRRWVAVCGPVCAVLILIAAGYDIAENLAILGVTEQHNPAAWASIRPHAMVKWACAFLAILLQAPFYFTIRRVLGPVMGIAAVAAGGWGFRSCLAGDERGIGMAMLPLLVAMLLMPVFLWRARDVFGKAD